MSKDNLSDDGFNQLFTLMKVKALKAFATLSVSVDMVKG